MVSTVAIECRYGYRQDGPELMKPVGETEFLESIGAESARDRAIKTRIAAAIVGYADLALGERVAAVLEAHLAASPGRFRGIRRSTTWDAATLCAAKRRVQCSPRANFARGSHGSINSIYPSTLGCIIRNCRSWPI